MQFPLLCFVLIVITYEMNTTARVVPHIGKVPDCQPKFKAKVNNPLVKRVDARPFKEMWSEILAYRMTHSEMRNTDLWKLFQSRISDIQNFNMFRVEILRKGLDKKSVSKALSEKEMTKVAVQTFADKMKERADDHLEKCSTYLGKAHKVVGDIQPDTENIFGYINLVKDVHREGRLLYNVDENKMSDPKLMHLAMLVAIRPEDEPEVEKLVEVVEI